MTDETVTIPDKLPHYPRILVGWIRHKRIQLPGNAKKADMYAATCERCSREVSRTADRTHARTDLIGHRAGCRPTVRT